MKIHAIKRFSVGCGKTMCGREKYAKSPFTAFWWQDFCKVEDKDLKCKLCAGMVKKMIVTWIEELEEKMEQLEVGL